MKRFVINILLFFVIIAVIDLGIGYAGDYMHVNARGGATKTLNDLVMKDKHDILILGSSRAHHHYDTPFLSDTLGVDVYNAGYDGNGIILAYGITDMILERYFPKMILFDVEPCFDINVYAPDNNNKRYLSNLKPYYKEGHVGEIFKSVSEEEWYKVHSGLIRYNTNVITLLADLFRSYNTSKKGFEPYKGKYTGNPVYVHENKKRVDTLKLFYLKCLINHVKGKKIPIVVVASPKYCVGGEGRLQPVKEICEAESVPFWDYYSDSIFLSHKEWFKEPMHLNDEGALNFSRLIAKRIKHFIESEE